MASHWQDIRYGLRILAKNPGFTIIVVLSLVLGIGATTAIFSVIHGALMDPYPYAGADRMVQIETQNRTGISNGIYLTGRQLRQLREAKSVESVLGQNNWELSTTGSDLLEDVRAVYLTSDASRYFGVPAILGRGLLPSDSPDGQDPQPVVVLSFSFWRRHFAGSPDVLGKTLEMGHKKYTIVGVLPQRFAWTLADAYLPLRVTNDPKQPIFISSVKLRAGVRPEAAQAEFQTLLEQFAKEDPEHFPGAFRVRVRRLIDEYGKNFEHMLYLLFGAVGLLLFIGCANVSILLLARGTSRRHELAVRAAVGATRNRILCQLLTESFVLSFSGAAFGILLAYSTLALIVKWLPIGSYPPEAAIEINLPVLGFSVGLALLTGFVFGLSPAFRLSRPEVSQVMQSSARTISGGVRAKRVHALLITGQIGLTLLLLTAAGAAMQGFLRLMHLQLGYDPHNTIVVGIPLHDNTYMRWEERAAYFSQLRQSLAVIPGVISAAISMEATPPASGRDEKVEIMSRPLVEEQHIRLSAVSSEYFSLLHVPFLYGRTWDQSETVRGARLAVINEAMAREYWPNGDALGHSIRMPELKSEPFAIAAPGSDQWFQIIGIVGDARNDGLANPVKPAVYMPYTIRPFIYGHILVHTKATPASVSRAVRSQVRSVDPDQQVEGQGQVASLEDGVVATQEWRQGHLATMLLGAFAFVALVLALVGLYSVVSYSVAQRTGELGIRVALGAQSSDVLWIVFSSVIVSIGGGLLLGISLSLTFAKLLARWVDGTSDNPLILLGVTFLLICASVLACLFPARRAMRVDPIVALRYE